jgi:hypothetical protein
LRLTLKAEGDTIAVRPKGAMPPELADAIRAHKPELLAFLRGESVLSEESHARAAAHPSLPLRRCGSLVCRGCHAHSPDPHREGCWAPRFEPCRSRWFWLSPHRAIKCVACASPVDLALVEAWVLARETGEGDDGWRIPGEILSLLHVETPTP